MATAIEKIEHKLDMAKTEQERASICTDTIKDTLDSAIPYYTTGLDTLNKYGDARFALGYLSSLINRLLPK